MQSVITLKNFCLNSLLLLLSVQSVQAESSVPINFVGILTEQQPCTVSPPDDTVTVEFGNVTDRYLYLNGRTPGKLFELNLRNCDISLGHAVKMTFTGAESALSPGLLMPDGGSQASGIAIGMETASGNALPVNQQSSAQAIVSGDNVIALKAYVQKEPGATIIQGMFTAIATFELEYE